MDLQFLKDNGYLIIPNILTNEECDQVIEKFNTWLRKLSDKPEYPLPIDRKGIIQQYNIGQQQFVWDVRQHPKVFEIFKTIWKTEDLLVSFDCMNYQVPPEITKKYSDKYGNNWAHCDQKRTGFECIQGFVNMYETKEDDGCFVCWPRSQQYHTKFIEEFGKEFKGDFVKLEEKHKQWFIEKGCFPIRVTCPKGGMVLWDSRVIHCNATALPEREKPTPRMVIYVCMTPKKLITQKDLIKKIKYFNEGRTTNHYPHRIKVFPKLPHLRTIEEKQKYQQIIENADKLFQPPKLTPLGRKLVGF